MESGARLKSEDKIKIRLDLGNEVLFFCPFFEKSDILKKTIEVKV